MAEMYSDYYNPFPDARSHTFNHPSTANLSHLAFPSQSFVNNNQPYSFSNNYVLQSKQQPFFPSQYNSQQNNLTTPQYPNSASQAVSSTLTISSNQYPNSKLSFSHSQSSSAHSNFANSNSNSSISSLSNGHSPRSENYSLEHSINQSFNQQISIDPTQHIKTDNYLNNINSPLHHRPSNSLPIHDSNNIYTTLEQNYPGSHSLLPLADTEFYDMSPSNSRAIPTQHMQFTDRMQVVSNPNDGQLQPWNPQFLNTRYSPSVCLPFQLQQISDPNQSKQFQNGNQIDPMSQSGILIAQNQNFGAITGVTKIPRALPTVNVMLSNIYLSVIHCGIQNPITGVRQYTQHCSYWNQEMDVYVAVNDPARRILYRAALLSDRFQCATNKVGMYLARRRGVQGGIFQATGFEYKPESGGKGLKVAAYFITREACIEFEKHWRLQAIKRVKRSLRESKFDSNEIETEKRIKREDSPTNITELSSSQ